MEQIQRRFAIIGGRIYSAASSGCGQECGRQGCVGVRRVGQRGDHRLIFSGCRVYNRQKGLF